MMFIISPVSFSPRGKPDAIYIISDGQLAVLASEADVSEAINEGEEDLFCPICQRVFTDPQLVTCCGWTFCNHCIRQYLDINHQCPKCNTPANQIELAPNPSVQEALAGPTSPIRRQTTAKKEPGGIEDPDGHQEPAGSSELGLSSEIGSGDPVPLENPSSKSEGAVQVAGVIAAPSSSGSSSSATAKEEELTEDEDEEEEEEENVVQSGEVGSCAPPEVTGYKPPFAFLLPPPQMLVHGASSSMNPTSGSQKQSAELEKTIGSRK